MVCGARDAVLMVREDTNHGFERSFKTVVICIKSTVTPHLKPPMFFYTHYLRSTISV